MHAHIVISGSEASRDYPVPMLDGTARLLGQKGGTINNSQICVRRRGYEIDSEGTICEGSSDSRRHLARYVR